VKKFLLFFVLVIIISLVSVNVTAAQSDSFNLQEGIVDVYLNGDGTARIEYTFTFQNNPGASPIEFVDVAFPPYTTVNENNITATVDGQPVSYISSSEYQGSGDGVAVALGEGSIPPGSTGTVKVVLGEVGGLIFQDSQDGAYASIEFSPAYFKTAYGSTKWTVNFHLPPGVGAEEPRWHAAPSGFPEQPDAYLDEEGRVTYSWTNENAQGNREYKFGASFPASVVSEGIVRQPDLAQSLGTNWDSIVKCVQGRSPHQGIGR